MKNFLQNKLSTRHPLLVLAAMTCTTPALAALSDTIKPYVGTSYGYEDNLLRLPEGAGDQSDTVRQVYVGVDLERPFGRQRVTASARLTKVSYQHFDQLNYDGKDLSAAWYWVVGNDFDGTLGATYLQSLSSFSDFHSSERSLRVNRTGYGDINYHLTRRWKLRARLNTDKFSYDLPALRYLDRTQDGREVGLDYQTLAGSTIGVQVRRIEGRYPYPRSIAGTLIDDGFTQNEVKFKLFWNFSEATQLQFLGGRVRRSHEALVVRDSSGSNGRLSLDWAVLPQLKLKAVGWREFSPYEGISAVNYSLEKGGSVGATWQASARVQYQAELRNVQREFVGLLISALPPDQHDRTRTASLSVNYQARNNIVLGAQLYGSQRSASSVLSSDYRAKGASLYANIQF